MKWTDRCYPLRRKCLRGCQIWTLVKTCALLIRLLNFRNIYASKYTSKYQIHGAQRANDYVVLLIYSKYIPPTSGLYFLTSRFASQFQFITSQHSRECPRNSAGASPQMIDYAELLSKTFQRKDNETKLQKPTLQYADSDWYVSCIAIEGRSCNLFLNITLTIASTQYAEQHFGFLP